MSVSAVKCSKFSGELSRSALSGISRREGENCALNNLWIHRDFFFKQVIILWKLRLIKSNAIPINSFSFFVKAILYLFPMMFPCAS